MNPRVTAALERTRLLVGPALEAAVNRLSPRIRRPGRYHFGWADQRGETVPGGGHGKGVRPTLALLSAEAVGAPPEVGLPGAVAVELVHNFSLVHDDIIDDDPERRHRATVWKVFGTGDAIVVGDALMLLAMEVLLDESTPERTSAAAELVRATADMIAGQYLDMTFDRSGSVDVEQCWEMVSLKTGALLTYACGVGAMLAGAPTDTVRLLGRFGDHLGRAFQAVDDLLGIWGDPAVTGKPVGNDLRNRKRSIPVIVALHSGTPAGDRLEKLYAQDRLDDADLARAADLVEEAGGREACLFAAREDMDKAAEALSQAGIEARVEEELMDLAEFVVNRQY
ncbi:MAG: polyprenyl synthetase family protein [Acidimicrobiia bacterium]|nr:polyprenyl synthetase family protein [Acidimicrobiia bacterium]